MGEAAGSPPGMHYCFLTLGTWQNASIVRLREIGAAMLERGIAVSYLIDDIPDNRGDIKAHPRAHLEYISGGTRAAVKARRRALKRLKPDFVHVLDPSPKAMLTLWRGHSISIIADWDEWPLKRKFGWFYRAHSWLTQRWAFRKASRTFVASRYMQEGLRMEYGFETVYLPYATYLTPHAAGPSPYREPTAVYMGSYYPSYDHDLLFEAAVLLKQRGKRIPMVFLGSGPDHAKWEAFVREHDLSDVTIAGFKSGEDLWQHLRHAHVLLFPIRPQILNLARCPSKTYAYAQAHRPVIANATGEVPTVLGELGHYVEPTAAAFADAIERLMSEANLPDVDYGVERHNWAARTDTLLAALPSRSSIAPVVGIL